MKTAILTNTLVEDMVNLKTIKSAQVLLTVLVCMGTGAQQVGFSVKPNGDMSTDLGTGISTLPRGGVITDAVLGIKLTAGWIQYQENIFYKAKSVSFSSKDGLFKARGLQQSVSDGSVSFQTLTFKGKTLKQMSAQQGKLLSGRVLVLKTNVTMASALQAQTIVLDLANSQGVIFGAFEYQNAGLKLESARPDNTSWIRFENGNLLVKHKAPRSLVARLKSYLEK